MMRRNFCLAASLGTLLFPGILGAQEVAKDWVSNCNDGSCTLSRGLVSALNNKQVATFLTVVTDQSEATQIGIALPLGTAIEAGVRFVVGDDIIEVPYQVCFPDGCRALREMTEEEFATLSNPALDNLEIQFFPFGSEKPVSLSMPFDGFEESVAALRDTVDKQ